MQRMTEEEKNVYEWALKQKLDKDFYARVARILADYIQRQNSGDIQIIGADPGSNVSGIKQTIIK